MLVNFLLVVVGCGQEVWNGDYVTYEHDAPLIPCGRTPEYVDGFVPSLGGELGLDISRKIPTNGWSRATSPSDVVTELDARSPGLRVHPTRSFCTRSCTRWDLTVH